jgi:hypothetical protein
MLPKFWLFVRPFVHSSYSSFVHSHYSSFIIRAYELSTIIIHRYYSTLLFVIVTIHRYYSSSLLFIDDICNYFFVVTIHCYYLSLLFIDHSITPNFNYSSIMLSSPPKTCLTNIPAIRTLVTDFPFSRNFPSGHPSHVSPSWARLTLRFLWTRLPNLDSNNSCF